MEAPVTTETVPGVPYPRRRDPEDFEDPTVPENPLIEPEGFENSLSVENRVEFWAEFVAENVNCYNGPRTNELLRALLEVLNGKR